MFTGIVEEIGHVKHISNHGKFKRIIVGAKSVLKEMTIGDSIAVDGVCQTVINYNVNSFEVESISETLCRSTLGSLVINQPVNLERALCIGDRLGGHIVQGHVDDIGRISAFNEQNNEWSLRIAVPTSLQSYIAKKGSITIDGISLTVADIYDEGFTVAVIPHTLKSTVLHTRRVGDSVNLEVDVIARYIERLLSNHGQSDNALNFDTLRKMGY